MAVSRAPVVLPQLALEEAAVLPIRGRTAAIDPLALALQEAREEGLRQGRERGLQAGYAEGLREGRALARREADEDAARLEREAELHREQRRVETRAALAAFQDATSHWIAEAEEDLVALCFEALGRVLGDRATRREQAREQVAWLLERWQQTEAPVLHLHPADMDLLEGLPATRPFTCVADRAVSFGGCIVRGSSGALDARLDQILEQIKCALLAARPSKESS